MFIPILKGICLSILPETITSPLPIPNQHLRHVCLSKTDVRPLLFSRTCVSREVLAIAARNTLDGTHYDNTLV